MVSLLPLHRLRIDCGYPALCHACRMEPKGRIGREDKMSQLFKALWNDESVQDLAEYGLLVALIAIVAVIGVTAFGSQIGGFFTNLGSGIGLP